MSAENTSWGPFEPVFAGYAERARASFARQGAMALIGATLVDVRSNATGTSAAIVK